MVNKMSKLLFSVYEDYILIDNITLIKEFSESLFKVNIDDVPYEINGEHLLLTEVTNNNKTIKISGKLFSIRVEKKQPKEKTSFIKKLLS